MRYFYLIFFLTCVTVIGLAGFRAIAGHAGVRGKTAILETPGEEPDDVRNMERIRQLFS